MFFTLFVFQQLRQAESNKSDGLEASAHALMQVLSGDDKKLVSELKILQKKCQTLEGHEDKIKVRHFYDESPKNIELSTKKLEFKLTFAVSKVIFDCIIYLVLTS